MQLTQNLTEDQRSIANKLGAAEHDAGDSHKKISKEAQEAKQDPTLPVNSPIPSPPIWKEHYNKRKEKNCCPCTTNWRREIPNKKQARNHGNEPSKGAKIDAEIKAEEDEILKKKGAK